MSLSLFGLQDWWWVNVCPRAFVGIGYQSSSISRRYPLPHEYPHTGLCIFSDPILGMRGLFSVPQVAHELLSTHSHGLFRPTSHQAPLTLVQYGHRDGPTRMDRFLSTRVHGSPSVRRQGSTKVDTTPMPLPLPPFPEFLHPPPVT